MKEKLFVFALGCVGLVLVFVFMRLIGANREDISYSKVEMVFVIIIALACVVVSFF